MRISDWSSDVCSSDVRGDLARRTFALHRQSLRKSPGDGGILKQGLRPARIDEPGRDDVGADILLPELGCKILDQLCLRGSAPRLEDLTSVAEGKSVSVRVDPGVRRAGQKKKQK